MNYIIPKCKIQLLGFTLSSNSILVNNSSFCSFSETDMEMDVSEQNNIEHVSSIISMERYDSQPLNSSLPELRRSNRLVLMLDIHPKLDLVTTRYSELHDLMNKPQLPSYFMLYQYSI